MIILIPQKSLKKKIGKWVQYKDFAIADATDNGDGEIRQYGNVLTCDDLAPTPTLVLIAQGTGKDVEIKRRRVNIYLDTWLNDESFNIKLHYLLSLIMRGYQQTGEDTNIFLVYRNPCYHAFQEAIVRYINETVDFKVAISLTHKMEKDFVKETLGFNPSKDYYKAIKSAMKRLAKTYKIKQEEMLSVEDYDGIY